MIFRRVRQDLIGNLLAFFQLAFKGSLQFRIWGEFLSFLELGIVNEELGLEHVHAVELCKQIRGPIGNRSEWVFGMDPLPCGECLVRRIEIQVVHLPVPGLEGRGVHRRGRRTSRRVADDKNHQRNQRARPNRFVTEDSVCRHGSCLSGPKMEAAFNS